MAPHILFRVTSYTPFRVETPLRLPNTVLIRNVGGGVAFPHTERQTEAAVLHSAIARRISATFDGGIST